ncbi:MAG: Flp pilus assembly complex ATPase component TadA [Armatimonadetes bacterium]|nr:Flp pilus assembly complex ATPase component TadA [Armatimonadota bacterium]
MNERVTLLQTFIDAGVVTPEVARQALEESRKTGQGIIELLVKAGALDEEDALQLSELQSGAPYVQLSNAAIDPEAIALLPESFSRKNHVVAIGKRDGEVTVAMADPLNVMLVDEIARITGKRVQRVLSREDEIAQVLDKHQTVEGSLEAAAKRVDERLAELGETQADKSEVIEDLAEDAPVVAFVNSLLERSITQRASDIHLEPGEKQGVVRCRIDGVLQDLLDISMAAYPAVLSRLKIVSGMDISERRKPQDGRFSTVIDGRSIDFRASVLPTVLGEKMVLRILDAAKSRVALSDLGLSDSEFERLEWAIKRPHGLFIVTGPTGSGKTTTLYAVLQHLNDTTQNIVTCEDPVEYCLERINQVQLNQKAGLTFAAFLRSVLRQDPDVIMVGEMRDTETMELGIRAALTGHMVLTTLHTNDAPGAVSRLLDMGAEPYLVASALVGVVAQRLVRRICEHCDETYIASETELKRTFPELAGQEPFIAHRGSGCRFCRETGYSGRLPVFELFIPSDAARTLIGSRATASELAAQAVSEGMTSLREAALRRVRAGETTLEEAARITTSTLAT